MKETRVYYKVEGNDGAGDGWRLWSRGWDLIMVVELLAEAKRKYERVRVIKVTETIQELSLEGEVEGEVEV